MFFKKIRKQNKKLECKNGTSHLYGVTAPTRSQQLFKFESWAHSSHVLCRESKRARVNDRRDTCIWVVPEGFQDKELSGRAKDVDRDRESGTGKGTQTDQGELSILFPPGPQSFPLQGSEQSLRGVLLQQHNPLLFWKKNPLRHRNTDIGVGSRPEHTEELEKCEQVIQNIYHRGLHTQFAIQLNSGFTVSWILAVFSFPHITKIECFLGVNMCSYTT